MVDGSTPALRRSLGLLQLTAGGIGIIIGAGVYVLLGAAAGEAGAAVWLGFVLAALLSALTALSYMELVSMFPSAGAEYEYTRHAFPGWMAFLVGWVMSLGLMVAAATISLGFARYLAYFVDVDVRVSAVALLALIGVIATIGIEQSARVSMGLSAVQVGGLLVVIAVGAPEVGTVNLLEGASLGGVFGAAALVFFAFIGFDEVITLAEETENPTRTVPLALMLALAICTLLYVAVAVTAVSVLGAETLAASERPLGDVLSRVLGTRGAGVMAVLAMITTTNTALLAVTAGSRLVYGMASRGALPSLLSVVHRRRRTPIASIVLSVVIAGAFVMFRDLKLVASVTDFVLYLVFLAVNATVVILRLKQPERVRAFRIPGSIRRVPILPVLGFGTVAVMMTQLDREAVALGLLLLAVGLLVAAVLKRFGAGGAV